MHPLLLIAFAVIAVWLFRRHRRSATGRSGPTLVRDPAKTATYRPTPSQQRSPATRRWTGAASDLHGLVDAFTGEPLNQTRQLHYCRRCGVYYHNESFDLIRSQNGGRCVSCLATEIIEYSAGQTRIVWREASFTPAVITLTDFRSHVGEVITFRGVVRLVLASRTGRDFALMFENKSWSHGLKMVVFRGRLSNVGGAPFLRSLLAKEIKVRGLLQRHPKYGYQIIVSERRMIEV